jgi:cytochrome c biogenesis protein CcdA
MVNRPDEKTPPTEATPRDGEKRWINILEEVVEEHETGRSWLQQAGIFLAWSAGFAVAAGLITTAILGFVELFNAGRQFTAATLSNYIFWASAILMIIGFLSPSATGLGQTTGKKEEDTAESREARSAHMLRQRMRRMYDPWRWRLWAGALLTFGLSALVGLAGKP